MENKNLLLSELEMQLRQTPEDAMLRWKLIKTKYEVVEAAGELLLGNANMPTIYEDADARRMLQDLDDEAKMEILGQIRSLSATQDAYREVENTDSKCEVYLAFNKMAREDASLAQEIYNALVAEGISVYYEPAMDLPGNEDAHRLFALENAKVLLLIGTDKNNLNSLETEGAWKRMLNIMARTSGKFLLPVYKDMRPEDFPGPISKIQGIDMGRIGSIQAILLPRVKELTGRDKQAVFVKGADGRQVNVSGLLTRIEFFVEDGDYKEANERLDAFKKNYGDEFAEYYLLKLKCKYKVNTDKELAMACKENEPMLDSFYRLASADRKAEIEALFASASDMVKEKEDALIVERVRKAHEAGNYSEVLAIKAEIAKLDNFTKYDEVTRFFIVAENEVETYEKRKNYKELVGDGSTFYMDQIKKKAPDRVNSVNDLIVRKSKLSITSIIISVLGLVALFFLLRIHFADGMDEAINFIAPAFIAGFVIAVIRRKLDGAGIISSVLVPLIVGIIVPVVVMTILTTTELVYEGKPLAFISRILAWYCREDIKDATGDIFQYVTPFDHFVERAKVLYVLLPLGIYAVIIGIKTLVKLIKQIKRRSANKARVEENRKWLTELEKNEYDALVSQYKEVVGNDWVEPVSLIRGID